MSKRRDFIVATIPTSAFESLQVAARVYGSGTVRLFVWHRHFARRTQRSFGNGSLPWEVANA